VSNGRRNHRSVKGSTLWFQRYHFAMILGLELCRRCRRASTDRNPLTFAHIISWADGGSYEKENTTILCQDCNQRQGSMTVIRRTASLSDEEALVRSRTSAAVYWQMGPRFREGLQRNRGCRNGSVYR
jgi:5-methylcytosine-specific restriction endonuclease McrA